MGRDCVSHTAPPPSMAHSRSCGAPKCTSARRPSRSSARSWASSTLGRDQQAGLVDPFGSAARQRPDGHTFAPGPALENSSGVALSITKWSGLTAPDTTASPRPGLASMTASCRLSGHRVRGEQDSGHGRVHHPLDHHGERDRGGADPVGGAVAHGAVRPERRPALPDGGQHGVGAHDVQEGVLLAGEAGEGQVLGGGGRAHRHRGVRSQRRVGVPDGLGNVSRDVGGQDERPGGGGQPGEPRKVIRGGRCQAGVDHVEPGGRSGSPVGLRGQAETGRNRQPGPQQFAEVGCLAADVGQLPGADKVQCEHQPAPTCAVLRWPFSGEAVRRRARARSGL